MKEISIPKNLIFIPTMILVTIILTITLFKYQHSVDDKVNAFYNAKTNIEKIVNPHDLETALKQYDELIIKELGSEVMHQDIQKCLKNDVEYLKRVYDNKDLDTYMTELLAFRTLADNYSFIHPPYDFYEYYGKFSENTANVLYFLLYTVALCLICWGGCWFNDDYFTLTINILKEKA